MIFPRVIVVGGGPAGCAAAHTLAKKSIDVTVIERGRPGKDKTCGDALVPPALELLHLFGIDQSRIQALGGYLCNRVDMYIDEYLLPRSEGSDNGGWVIPRSILDQEIRDVTARHVSFNYETTVTDVKTKSSEGLILLCKYQNGDTDYIECDAVVLSTGSINQLSKKFGIHGNPLRALAISAYAEIEHSNNLIFQFIESCEPGYRWLFPVSKKTANVGICILNEKLKQNLVSLGDELLKDHHAALIEGWRGGWGPLWSGECQCWHHPNGIISCGDAAGLVNPYSGEGMTAALKSGEQAGKAMSGYLLGNRDLSELEKYSHWITKHFQQQYELTPLMQTWNKLCGIGESQVI